MSLIHSFASTLLKPTLLFRSRNRLPQLDGASKLSGLQQPVIIRRDEHGVPSVTAKNQGDLFFAQGVLHAQDRLWQMELNRRAANGTVSELVGEAGIDTDRLSRTLGFRRLAPRSWEALSLETQEIIEAYCAGINAYLNILLNQNKLPVEFSLLRHQPDEWLPLDVVAYGRLQMFVMSMGWGSALPRAKLIELVGAELAAEIDVRYPSDNPVHLPAGIELNRLHLDPMVNALNGPFIDRAMDGGGRGSNGWVLAPSRTESGEAMLANDMHLPLPCPSLWYAVRLQVGDYDCGGASMPGIPGILVGRNRHIAWGATLSYADVEDLFIERQNPENSHQVRYLEEWETAQIISETIHIKGDEPLIEPVMITRHGPVLSGILNHGEGIALCSKPLQEDVPFDGFFMLNRAADWGDFVEAVRHIPSPSLNLLYADAAGNIGYYVSGNIPVRKAGDGRLPVPGWTGEYEWAGEIPFEEMPHALNPRSGVIVSCNHRLMGDDYPHFLGDLFMNGNRAKRLHELIAGKEQISAEDCRQWQMDQLSLPAISLTPRLTKIETDDVDALLAIELLRDWDGELAADSVPASIYEVTLAQLAEIILKPTLGGELLHEILGLGSNPFLAPKTEFHNYWTVALERMLDNPNSGWLPGNRFAREGILSRALSAAVGDIRQRLGDDPRGWGWGKLHQVTFAHALAVQPPLDKIFNVGAFPLGGDPDTVAQAVTRPDAPYETNAYGVSFRQIVDWGQARRSQIMHAPGQSGQVGSPNYADLAPMWLVGELTTMFWDEEDVEQECRHQLTLNPLL